MDLISSAGCPFCLIPEQGNFIALEAYIRQKFTERPMRKKHKFNCSLKSISKFPRCAGILCDKASVTPVLHEHDKMYTLYIFPWLRLQTQNRGGLYVEATVVNVNSLK